MSMEVMNVVGARPNFMKAAPILREMSKYPDLFEPVLVHTGQHYDYEMSKVFFEDLELPEPDIYLGVGSGTHAEQTGRIMIEFEKVLLREKPDLVIVVGDVMVDSLLYGKKRAQKSHILAKLGLMSYFNYAPVSPMNSGINSIDPLGYLDFLNLAINAKFVMTDSGGIQEETTALSTRGFKDNRNQTGTLLWS